MRSDKTNKYGIGLCDREINQIEISIKAIKCFEEKVFFRFN